MQLILFIIQKQLNMNNQLKCDTVAQYKAYQWIKKNFDINYLTISIHASYSLLVKDMHNKNAIISYNKNKVTIHYDDGSKETFKLKSHEPCL